MNKRAGPFDRIVSRCLEKQPAKRYQTFDGLLTDLEEAYRQLTGVTYIRHNQDESASTTYEYSIDRARSFFILGNQDMALGELEDILLGNPTAADAWQLKGSVLAQQERPHDALTCFEKVLQISPSTSAQISKGMAYLMLGRVDDAIEILKAFVDDASRDKAHVALVNLGIAYQMKGKNAEALQCFAGAIRIDPWSRSAWVNKANVLRTEGRSDEAMLCLKQAFIYSISFKDRIELIFDLGEADEYMCDMALHALTRIPPQVILQLVRRFSGDRVGGNDTVPINAKIYDTQMYAKVSLLVAKLRI